MLLSIVIPSYNHERFVLSTIRAAARIPIQDKEITVIDDGSSDGSVHSIRQYLENPDKAANIRFIARENRGLVKTLNEGLALSTGKYFYGVASDDIPIPEGISRLIEILEGNSSLQFVLGNALFMESEEQTEFSPVYGDAHADFFRLSPDRLCRELFRHYPHPLLLQSTLFTKAALIDLGGWREDITLDDYSLFIRLFSRFNRVGEAFEYHPEIMACFYRRHQANISRNVARQFITVDQALTLLCPPEWRDAALLRNSVAHGVTALEIGKPLLAANLVHSTARRVGLLRSVRASISELRDFIIFGFTRSSSGRVSSSVRHEPAINSIGPSRITDS